MDADSPGALERKVLSGGALLAMRQGFSIVVGLVGLVYLTATIGPAAYGTYIAAARILDFLASLTQWNAGTFLLRSVDADFQVLRDRIFTLMLGVGVGASVTVAWMAGPIGRWVGIESLDSVAIAVVSSLTLRLLYAVVVAGLEKRLDYAPVALIEMFGQLAFYGVAILFAVLGWGVWSVVMGLWSQQLLQLVAAMTVARYLPRPRWSSSSVKQMLAFGSGMTASQWTGQFGKMAGPLLVGRLAGAEAVGTLALAIRIVHSAGFIQSAAWRLSLAAFSKVREEKERLRTAVAKGVRLETHGVGYALVCVLVLAPIAIPMFMSEKWTPTLTVMPFVALAFLANSLFSLPASALFVLGRAWSVALINLVSVGVMICAAWILLPKYGLIGFGMALVLAEVANALTIPVLARQVGHLSLGLALLSALLLGLALFWTHLGAWALLPALLLPAHPAVHGPYIAMWRDWRSRKTP